MSEPVQENHFKEFLVICILLTVIVILGYYVLNQKNHPPKKDQASSEDLMSAMLQTKGMMEAKSFCLIMNEAGEISTETNQKCASEEALRAILAQAVEKTDALRVEGSEKMDLQKLVRIFEIAREVGFQDMKYQMILFVKDEQKSSDVERSDGKTDEESH